MPVAVNALIDSIEDTLSLRRSRNQLVQSFMDLAETSTSDFIKVMLYTKFKSELKRFYQSLDVIMGDEDMLLDSSRIISNEVGDSGNDATALIFGNDPKYTNYGLDSTFLMRNQKVILATGIVD